MNSIPGAIEVAVECYTSRSKVLGILLITGAMVGASYYCTTLPGITPRVVGWAGVTFFGVGLVVWPIRLASIGPQLVISEEGIDGRRLGIGVINWDEIRSVHLVPVNSVQFLWIELADPDKHLSRMTRWQRALASFNRGMGFPPLWIGLSDLRPGAKEIWEYLRVQTRAPICEETLLTQ